MKQKREPADFVSELLELAESAHLEDGFFNDDVLDVLLEEAKSEAKKINEGTLMGQLEFLLESGYTPGRLRQLIEDS